MLRGSVRTTEEEGKPLGRYKLSTIKHCELSLKVIAGQVGLVDGAEKHGVAWRTLLRYVQSDLDGLQLRTVQMWPSTFRLALAHEIEHELPKNQPAVGTEVQNSGLGLRKRAKTIAISGKLT